MDYSQYRLPAAGSPPQHAGKFRLWRALPELRRSRCAGTMCLVMVRVNGQRRPGAAKGAELYQIINIMFRSSERNVQTHLQVKPCIRFIAAKAAHRLRVRHYHECLW